MSPLTNDDALNGIRPWQYSILIKQRNNDTGLGFMVDIIYLCELVFQH